MYSPWTHRNLNQVNSTIQMTEMIYNEMAFRNLFGWIPTYFRPPYLECSASSGCANLMSALGYHIVNTNLDTKDYMYDTPSTVQQDVHGDWVLFHPVYTPEELRAVEVSFYALVG